MKRISANFKLVLALFVGALAGCATQAPPPAGPYVTVGPVNGHRMNDAWWALGIHGIYGYVNQFGGSVDETYIWVRQSQQDAAEKALAPLE